MSVPSSTPNNRSFLLLQGVASPFFHELEIALLRNECNVLKVNFNAGDVYAGEFFSQPKNHINFTGQLDELTDFYLGIYDKYKITDIALFGDTRPVHQDAIRLANDQNMNVHVFEEGYFRPNFVTLDSGGVNAYSSVYKASQNQPEWFLENALKTKEIDQASLPTGGNLLIRGWHDIRYHLTKWALRKRFPHYQTHRPDSPMAEYWGFFRRIPAVFVFYNEKSRQQINSLIKRASLFYLLPLQLDADSQMRLHSPFKSLEDVIDTALKSFARFSPKHAELVIKLHPLDPWFVNYPEIIAEKAKQYSIDPNRIVYLEAGNLNKLLKHCSGTILVNSTVGTSALAAGCPVIALGSAIYDIDGLTFQGSLDDFWTQATAPNKTLFHAFRQCYIQQTQINGSFYNRKGIKMAVKNSLTKLMDNT